MRQTALLMMVAVLAMTGGASGQATRPAGDAAADDLLKSKGLVKTGLFWVLDTETSLQEQMRAVAKVRAGMEENARKRTAVELDLRKLDAQGAQMDREFRALNDQISKKDLGTAEHNRLVGQINSLATKLRDAQRVHNQREKDLKGMPDGRDDYIEALSKLAEKMESANARYEELAKDPEVAKAIGRLSEVTKSKVRLGPTPGFVQRLAAVRKDRAGIEQRVIKLDFEGGVPQVSVTLNGKVTRRMVVDSGAATVLITADVARELGMKPGADDPVVHLVVANGKRIDGRLMRLRTVRLGQFVVEDVECAVLPASLGEGAGMLLGGSFLRNFVYRMDLDAGELHLSQVSGKPATGPEEAAAKGRATTTTGPVAAAPSDGSMEVIGQMRGDVGRHEGGVLVLKADERATTDRWYQPPVTFRVTAMTDATNIRLRYGVKQLIFNWELNPTELRVQGGVIADAHKAGAGEVPVNKWVEIELSVLPDAMTVAVDGEERQHIEADFSDVREPLTVFTHGSTVRVKSVEVVEGK